RRSLTPRTMASCERTAPVSSSTYRITGFVLPSQSWPCHENLCLDSLSQPCEAGDMAHRTSIDVATRGRGTYDITSAIADAVARSGVVDGLATVFIHHTSASLIVCENADPAVRTDLDAFFARLVPDGDRLFTHDAEGDDDMPAHVRSVLTQTSLGIPV